MIDRNELRCLCAQALTLQQIADHFGVSRQRIHQLIAKSDVDWYPIYERRRDHVPPCPIGGACYVPLSNGEMAIVDAQDFARVMGHHWSKKGRYAATSQHGQRRHLQMHRLILHAPDGMEIDHINGNGLDNRRCNLRVCTRRENSWNAGKRPGRNPYKGVSLLKQTGRWRAYITAYGTTYWLGYYDTPEAAAYAYNKAAIQFHGSYARLNEIATTQA